VRYLFFTNTPKHVHVYRHVVDRLLAAGHEVRVFARDYGCTVELADYFDLPYTVYGTCDTTKGSLFRELPRHYASIVRKARAYDPDVVFGISAYAAHAGAITGADTVLVFDTEPTSLDHAVSRPFADAMLTPDSFEKDLGPRHYRFRGFMESAYLHPDVYEPTTDARAELGLDPDEPYVILRFNAWGSHHDVGKSGFTDAQKRELVERLGEHATVFVSDEAAARRTGVHALDCHPAHIHAVLTEASLLVADTQTMVTEAGLLGTPAIRSNDFVGDDDMGNFRELERRGLVENLVSFDDVLERAVAVLTGEGTRSGEAERERYRRGLVDLSDVLTAVAETPTRPGRVEGLRPGTAAVPPRS